MLEQSIQKILEEFDEIIGPIPDVVEKYRDKTCPICGQPHDKSKQVKELKQFLSSSLRKIAEESVEEAKMEIVKKLDEFRLGNKKTINFVSESQEKKAKEYLIDK